ncbi:hypothetical protein [Rhabdothermincola sediminis]|uniref:hypothetical protein n=1 Tax=Rhabdothermincola sediminis TaxID=2751370 RepID=UPI001AA08A77|nr:hypothetical protein [Rhabdothermincola sediminis]
MSRPSDRASVVLEVPDGLPQLTGDAARLLLAMVRDAAREPSVVELRIGRSPDEPEAVAS